MPFQLVKSIPQRGSVNGTVFPFLISFHPTPWPFSVLSQLDGPVEGTGLLDLMSLALSKHLPPALLLKPAHSTGPWHLDHIHFLLWVSLYSYINLIPHEECIVSIGTVKALGCLYSLYRDLRWGESGLVWLLTAECSAIDNSMGTDPVCSVYTEQPWQPLQVLSPLPLK